MLQIKYKIILLLEENEIEEEEASAEEATVPELFCKKSSRFTVGKVEGALT